jgi:pyroglutamyl-peptidase
MKRLLITGFDPFGGATVNPSWMAVERLPDQIGECVLCKLQIPTVFGKAAAAVLEIARQFSPDTILCIGQAGGRAAVTPERIGVNIRDARIPDNAGNQPRGEFVDPQGPAAYFSTLPVEAMAQAIRDAGVDATVSNSAGAFVCNDTLYLLLHKYHATDVKVGFIHVPYLPEQGSPSLPLEETVKALYAAILACE